MMVGRPMLDAVVVGGGPAGLTAAIALAGAGVPTARRRTAAARR